MAYHVTIDPTPSEDGEPIEAIAEAMVRLGPASIAVDLAGSAGRVVLASLQARGLPATALEKRPRPTLPEIQRAEDLSRVVDGLRADLEDRDLELKLLREYRDDVRILIQRLD